VHFTKIGALLLSLGLGMIVISGLEKVILFSAVFSKTHAMSMESIRINIPDYIWNITEYTYISGLVLLILGVIGLLAGIYLRTKK